MTIAQAHRQIALAIVLGFLFAATSALAGATVLIIWDTKGAQVDNLTHKLEAANLKVVLSDTNESAYNGKNPALTGIDVVVHLNGTTYNTEMPIAGQKALERFVRDGGGYIHHEWNAYQLTYNQMKWMRNLILFDRTSGFMGDITIERVKGQAMHPVVWEIPPKFTINGGCNIGHVHVFEDEQPVVLAKDSQGNDAIAVREFGLGRIVGFHHAGNWNYTALSGKKAILDKREARRLFIDAVLWAHGCTKVFTKGPRKQTCEKIAAKRAKKSK
jgi:hypothetical protein